MGGMGTIESPTSEPSGRKQPEAQKSEGNSEIGGKIVVFASKNGVILCRLCGELVPSATPPRLPLPAGDRDA